MKRNTNIKNKYFEMKKKKVLFLFYYLVIYILLLLPNTSNLELMDIYR